MQENSEGFCMALNRNSVEVLGDLGSFPGFSGNSRISGGLGQFRVPKGFVANRQAKISHSIERYLSCKPCPTTCGETWQSLLYPGTTPRDGHVALRGLHNGGVHHTVGGGRGGIALWEGVVA